MEFKVGDLVEVVCNEHTVYRKGEKLTVAKIDEDGDVYDYNDVCVMAKRLKLSENKNELSELKETVFKLQARVEQLGRLVEDSLDESNDEVFTYEDYKKLVQEAKKFVNDNLADGYISNDYCFIVDLKVNKDKETVVALAKSIGFNSKVLKRGISKCMKDDLFQEDIGKAIALGRLLGRDVSRFTNI